MFIFQMSQDPCVRKNTMPRPVTTPSTKRPREENEEVSNEAKTRKEDKLYSLLVESSVLKEDLRLSDSETSKDCEVINLDTDSNDSKQNSNKTTTDESINISKINKIKSKEYISDSENEEEDQSFKNLTADKITDEKEFKKAMLISPMALSKQTNVCRHVYIKGSKKGIRCSNTTKSEFCSTHSQKSKILDSNNTSKEEINQIKLQNSKLVEELNSLKQSVQELTTKIVHKETIRRLFIQNFRMKKSLEQSEKNFKEMKENLRKELKETQKKLEQTELWVKNIRQNSPLKTLITRLKLKNLNTCAIYKLLRFTKENIAVVEHEEKQFEVILPKLMEKKNESEGWGLKYSEESKKMDWVKM